MRRQPRGLSVLDTLVGRSASRLSIVDVSGQHVLFSTLGPEAFRPDADEFIDSIQGGPLRRAGAHGEISKARGQRPPRRGAIGTGRQENRNGAGSRASSGPWNCADL